MSGWIKLEKDLREDLRVKRMALALCNAHALQGVTHGVTMVLGGLAQLWMHADSFAREDDTLDITADEIDQLTGIKGFAQLIPADWLEILDPECVKLPGFQEHNGSEAKRRALTSKRVQRLRRAESNAPALQPQSARNAHALPDQTRPDQTRPDQREGDAGEFSLNGAHKPTKAKRAKRVPSRRAPPDFSPDLAFAIAEIPDIDAAREAAKFMDCEFQKPRSDWAAAWRNWIRKAREQGSYTRATPPDPLDVYTKQGYKF